MKTALTGVGNNNLFKTGLGGVRSGEVFSVKIIENKNGLIKAYLRGKVVDLKGPMDLREGHFFRVKAQWNGNTLVLNRIDRQNTIISLFESAGYPDGEKAAVLLFEAARRAGLTLGEDNLKLLRRILRKKKDLMPEDARIAAESLRKGLSPEDMLTVYDPNEQGDYDDEKTMLFNHLNDGNTLWFIVPFKFNLDADVLQGSLRIKRDLNIRKITAFVIETFIDNQRLFFFMDNYQSRNKKIKVFSDKSINKTMKKRIKHGLTEILCNLKFKIDDNIIENCFEKTVGKDSFDGFSCGTGALKGIEEMV